MIIVQKQLLALFRGRNKIQCINDSFPVTSAVSGVSKVPALSIDKQDNLTGVWLWLSVIMQATSWSHFTDPKQKEIHMNTSLSFALAQGLTIRPLYLFHWKEAYLSAGINGHRGQQGLTVANGRCSVLAALTSLLSQLCSVVRKNKVTVRNTFN